MREGGRKERKERTLLRTCPVVLAASLRPLAGRGSCPRRYSPPPAHPINRPAARCTSQLHPPPLRHPLLPAPETDLSRCPVSARLSFGHPLLVCLTTRPALLCCVYIRLPATTRRSSVPSAHQAPLLTRRARLRLHLHPHPHPHPSTSPAW